MDRTRLTLVLALGVCALARAERFDVQGQDRAGGAVRGTVEIVAREAPDGQIQRRLRARLGALRLTGSVSEDGTLTLDAEDQAQQAGDAEGTPKSSVGFATLLEGREAPAPAAEAAPVGVATREPASGRVQLQDGVLRLDLLDADGRPLFRVAGRSLEAASAASVTASGGASRDGIRARGGAPTSTPTSRTPAQRAVERVAAAEDRVDAAARKLATGDPGVEDAQRHAEAAYGGDALAEPAPPLEEDAWAALRADYAQALSEGDLAQEQARAAILDGGDVDAAHALVEATSARIDAWDRAPEGQAPVARTQVARLRDQRRHAQELRDRLEGGATRAVVQDRDLLEAEALVHQRTERLGASQVRLADDDDVTEDERAEHARLVELQRQAAEVRDRLHDRQVREVLTRGDVEAAAALAADTADRLAQSELEVRDAWDEATAVRDEHARLAWHHQNAVELRAHVLQAAGRRALDAGDLAAAHALADATARELATAQARLRRAEEPTEVARGELRRLEGQHLRATERRTRVHREALAAAEGRRDLGAALELLAEDSARLAAFAVANQTRAGSLGAVERAHGEALMEYHQDAIALRLELSERLLQEARLHPERARTVIAASEAGLQAFDREFAARGLSQGPWPQVVVEERAAVARQLADARALAARAR